MSAEKSHAIVLRVIDFSETSCVVTLFTREFGKITGLAKGARRRNSPFEAALDVLSICRIVFLDKTSGAMDLLTEAKLERRFRSASSDLNRLYSAFYVIELLRLLTEEKDPHPELYDVAVSTMVAIDEADPGAGSSREWLLKFEVHALRLLGHFPMLGQCVGCGRPRLTKNRVYFGLNEGGVLCQKCLAGKSSVVKVSAEAVQWLDQLKIESERTASGSRDRVKESKESELLPGRWNDRIDQDERDEVRRLMEKYLTHLIGYPPRMHKYLNVAAKSGIGGD